MQSAIESKGQCDFERIFNQLRQLRKLNQEQSVFTIASALTFFDMAMPTQLGVCRT